MRPSVRNDQTTAAFTQRIGGSEAATHSNDSPPSRPRQSWPVVVPNQTEGWRPSSRSIASRSTVNQASFFGRPSVSRCHFSPAFSLRHTAGRAPGQVRVAGSSGRTYTVFASCGCTTIGKPKSLGNPLAMLFQLRPPSSLRSTPSDGSSSKAAVVLHVEPLRAIGMGRDFMHALAELGEAVRLEAGADAGVFRLETLLAVAARVMAARRNAEMQRAAVVEDRVQAESAVAGLPLPGMGMVGDSRDLLPRIATVAAAEERRRLDAAKVVGRITTPRRSTRRFSACVRRPPRTPGPISSA